ncbi:6-bladed beta-propeller [Candidatus Zixiibacteriota bacterium]
MSVSCLIPRSSSRRSFALCILPLLISSLLIACATGAEDGWSGMITLEDGVVHIYNPDQPLWGEEYHPLNELEILGGADAELAALFAEPICLITGSDGTRYVLDAKDTRVLRFARDGEYLGSFGREGEGPGEFSSPSSMTMLPGEIILVADPGRRRFSRFSTEGRFLGSITLQRDIGQIRASRSGIVYMHSQQRGMVVSLNMGVAVETEEEKTLIDILDDRGERTGGFGVVEQYDGMMLGSWMNKVLPSFTRGDTMVLNHMGKDRIDLFTPDGTLVRVAHRSIPFEPVEPLEENNQTVHDDGSVSFSMTFEFDILSTGFAVAPDGSYWAALVALTQTDRREGVEEEDEISQEWAVDLFDSDGRWLARHPLGIDYPHALLDWGPAGLYILNPEGDATVRRFEVVPPA